MSIQCKSIDNAASAADIQVAAAPAANQVIRVLSFVLIAGGAVTVQYASGTAGSGGQTALTGPMPITAGQGIWPGWIGDDFHGRACHFESKPGEGMVLKFGGGVQVSGYVNYWVAPAS